MTTALAFGSGNRDGAKSLDATLGTMNRAAVVALVFATVFVEEGPISAMSREIAGSFLGEVRFGSCFMPSPG